MMSLNEIEGKYAKKIVQVNKNKYELFSEKNKHRKINEGGIYSGNVKYFIIPEYANICKKFYFDYDFAMREIKYISLTINGHLIHEVVVDESDPKMINTIEGKKKVFEFFPMVPFIILTPSCFRCIEITLKRTSASPINMYYDCLFININDRDDILNKEHVYFSNEEYYSNKYWNIVYDNTNFPSDIINLVLSYLPRKRTKYIAQGATLIKQFPLTIIHGS